jgi:hypothetical protein
MARADGSVTFYFFDIDDNTLFLGTRIVLRNRNTHEERQLGTEEFAHIRHMLGEAGEWEAYERFDGTYRYFRDRQDGELEYFVNDVAEAISDSANTSWQAPSWRMFVHACTNKGPLVFITARGHSPETIRAGIKLLADAGHIPCEPNYLAIFPVSNDAVKQSILRAVPDPAERRQIEQMRDATSALKRFAIWQAVDLALEKYGAEPPHRFGMSDDDPGNIDLIVKAMCDCKTRHPDKRFFAIDTHKGEHVKLEVFPIDFPVTRELAPGEVVG